MDMDQMRTMMAEKPQMAEEGMKEWSAWMEKHAADFADAGAPIGKNTEVSAAGATEKSNDIAGYSILQAESKEAALALLADNPHFKMPGATADLAEIVAME